MLPEHPAQRFLLVITGLVTAIGIALIVAWQPEFISRDGAQYLSIAQNLATGDGNSTSVIFYEKHYQQNRVPAPQTTFPPGYPFAVAAIVSLGIPADNAGFAVSLFSFSASVFLLFSLMRLTDINIKVAAGMSVAWALLTLNYYMVLDTISESLFIALTLGSVLAFCKASAISNDLRRTVLLVVAGGLAAAAFTVRYAGLFFVLALGTVGLLEWFRRKQYMNFKAIIALLIMPVVVVATLFLRNYLLVGDLFGGPRINIVQPLLLVIKQFYWSLGGIFGLSASGLLAGQPAEIFLALLILSCLVLFFLFRHSIRFDGSRLRSVLSQRVTLISLVYLVVGVVFLAYIGLTSKSDPPSARFVLPLVPFMMIVAAATVPSGSHDGRMPRFVRLTPVVLLAAMYIFGQLAVLRDFSDDLGPGSPERIVHAALNEQAPGGTVRTLILSNYKPTGNPVLSNESQLLSVALKVPTLGLTAAIYTTRIWDQDNVVQLLCAYDVRVLLLFPELLDNQDALWSNYVFFRELLHQPLPEWLELDYQSPTVRVYSVNRSQDSGSGPCAS